MAEVHTKRNLKARHLEMIAIGGTIGTGLFVGSGVALNSAGPAGTLAAYSITGVFVYFIVCSLGEMAALLPVSGSFNEYASRFVDPSLGFTMGWNYWFSWAITLPIEMAAASLVMQFWFPNVPPFVWSTIVLAVATILNIFSVKAFGEAEFWFSLVKVVAVIIFIIFGLVVALKDGVYFTNWNIPQAPFVGGVAGTFSAFMTAFFSYGGTEIVGIAAGEAANPTVTIPRAIKNTFYRILIFYMGAIFVIGLLVPFNAPGLADSASRTSPFTLALQAAKVAGASDFINAVVVVALMSAANSSMYSSSRTLMALASEGKAPRFFAKTTAGGVPVYALMPTFALSIFVIILTLLGAGNVFEFLVNFTGLTILLSWAMISLIHLRFRRAFAVQGYSLEDLPYIAPLYPYGDIIAVGGSTMVVLGTIYSIITDPAKAYSIYVWIENLGILVVFPIIYFAHKFTNGTKWVPLEDCDFVTGCAEGTIIPPQHSTGIPKMSKY